MANGIVLVVEDDQGLRETLEDLLRGEGYSVLLARDGLDALEKLDSSMPSVILLDLMMPRLDGFGFAAELDRRGLRPMLPIIVLTADGSARKKAERIGAEGHLAKPFDIPELLDEVARLAAP